MTNLFSRKLMVAAVAVALVGGFSADASAREKNTSGTFKNKVGNTTTWQKNTNREKGSGTKTFNWQNKNGEGQRTSQKNWDKESGTATGTRTTTTAKGGTATNTWSAQKTDDGRISSGTREGYNGKTYVGNTTVTKNEDGSRTKTKTVTNEEGESRTFEKTVNRYND